DEDESQRDRHKSRCETSATALHPENNTAAAVDAENDEAAGGETGPHLNDRKNPTAYDPTDRCADDRGNPDALDPTDPDADDGADPGADDRGNPTAHERPDPDAYHRTDDRPGQWRRRGARADHKTA